MLAPHTHTSAYMLHPTHNGQSVLGVLRDGAKLQLSGAGQAVALAKGSVHLGTEGSEVPSLCSTAPSWPVMAQVGATEFLIQLDEPCPRPSGPPIPLS